MSSTRRAVDKTVFRPERYCSSPALERGLPGNLVGMRSKVLSAEDRALVYFVLSCSHEAGGLDALANELIAGRPHMGTETMLRLGVENERRYSAAEVESFRKEFADASYWRVCVDGDLTDLMRPTGDSGRRPNRASRPSSYAASDYEECVRAAAGDHLATHLRDLCVNPEMKMEDAPWYFPGLRQALCEIRAQRIAAVRRNHVVTAIGAKIRDTLDFALAQRATVLITGLSRTGKTFAVMQWCREHPGQACYVQVPSTNDDLTFMRAVAKGCGIASAATLKALQLRVKVESFLQTGGMMVVFDESAFLWPVLQRVRESYPRRITWLMTALLNHQVPCAMIATPQFSTQQREVERHTTWNSDQFEGRIDQRVRLPDSLSPEDIEAVARAIAPECDDTSIRCLVSYVRAEGKRYLANIGSIIKRARYDAGIAGRPTISAQDIARVIEQSALPSPPAKAVPQVSARPVPAPEEVRQPLPTPRAPGRTPARPHGRRSGSVTAAPSTKVLHEVPA